MYYGAQNPTRYNGRCTRCGQRASILLVELRNTHVVGQDVAVDDQGREFDFRDGFWVSVPHECSGGQVRTLKLERVRGVYNPGRECNAKCMSAIGHDCECRCGGKNHGAGHTIG